MTSAVYDRTMPGIHRMNFVFGAMHIYLSSELPAKKTLMEANVCKINRLGVDTAFGRSDPASHFAALEDAMHQAVHERAIVGSGKPFVLVRVELLQRNRSTVGPSWDV